MDLSYIINHLGEEREQYQYSVSPPIFESSNFTFPSVAAMRQQIPNEQNHPFYTRGYNPTVAILRKKLAALEKADDALVFASGSAAISAAVMGNIKANEHIICVKNPYSWTKKLITNNLVHFGVTASYIDGTAVENFEAAIQPNTKIIFLESPNSFTFEQQDITAVCALAKKHNILTIVDNSYASPLNQNPIEMGADIVVHSASKYICGHSDLVAGLLCANQAMINKLFTTQYMNNGGIIHPHSAWLLIRSLRTLPLRMERVGATTMKVVSYLYQHPKVAKVHFPFIKENPQYELTKKQLRYPSGQFSIELKTEETAKIEQFCDSLKRFLLACSWGGHESLIFPITALNDSNNYGQNPYPNNLIRFYVGLEDADILIEDLKQALDKI